jgi:hypothetical protein
MLCMLLVPVGSLLDIIFQIILSKVLKATEFSQANTETFTQTSGLDQTEAVYLLPQCVFYLLLHILSKRLLTTLCLK